MESARNFCIIRFIIQNFFLYWLNIRLFLVFRFVKKAMVRDFVFNLIWHHKETGKVVSGGHGGQESFHCSQRICLRTYWIVTSNQTLKMWRSTILHEM